MLGLFYCTSVIGIAECSRTRFRLECLLICLLLAEGIFAFVVAMVAVEAVDDKTNTASSALGLMGLVMVMFLFASPLSTLASVARTKNSASISRPFCVVQFANCAVWLAYGIMVGDDFIAAPNGFGLGTAVLQGVLIALFPRRSEALDPLLGDSGGKTWDDSGSGLVSTTQRPTPHTPPEALSPELHGHGLRHGRFRRQENLSTSATPTTKVQSPTNACKGPMAKHHSDCSDDSSWPLGRAQGFFRGGASAPCAQPGGQDQCSLIGAESSLMSSSTPQVPIVSTHGDVLRGPDAGRGERRMARGASARRGVLTWSEASQVLDSGDGEDETGSLLKREAPSSVVR